MEQRKAYSKQFKNLSKIKLNKIVIAILFLILGFCKENPAPEGGKSSTLSKPLSGVVVFSVGDVITNGKKAKQGDIVNAGEKVVTGKKSSCEIQIREHDAEVLIQLKQNSEFSLDLTTSTGEVKGNISIGSALFKVGKPLKKGESVRVKSPTFVAGVRGTEFAIDVAKNGDSSLQVVSGKVATHPRLSEIDELPAEVKDNSKFIQSTEAILAKKETIVEPGNQIQVTKKQTNQILKDTGLGDAIQAGKKEIQNSSEKKVASQAIDSLLIQEKADVVLAKLESPQSTAMKPKELESKLKEFEKLIAIEQSKLTTEEGTQKELAKINVERKDALIKKIEEITGKSSETLILTNGTRIKGVIFQEGNSYIVLTPEGRKEFSESQVEGTEF